MSDPSNAPPPDGEAHPVSKEDLDDIIRHHLYAAVAVSLVPIPMIDFIGLTGIQLNMLRKIANKYGVPFRKDAAKNVISSLVGGALPGVASGPLAASVTKFIPFLGQAAAIVAMPATAGAATYAIGKVFVQHFASGGTFLTFDPEKVRDYYETMFQEGQKAAEKARAETKKESDLE